MCAWRERAYVPCADPQPANRAHWQTFAIWYYIPLCKPKRRGVKRQTARICRPPCAKRHRDRSHTRDPEPSQALDFANGLRTARKSRPLSRLRRADGKTKKSRGPRAAESKFTVPASQPLLSCIFQVKEFYRYRKTLRHKAPHSLIIQNLTLTLTLTLTKLHRPTVRHVYLHTPCSLSRSVLLPISWSVLIPSTVECTDT